MSIAANIAHSLIPPAGASLGWHPHGGAIVAAAFWPVSLLVSIEIMARNVWPVGWRWSLLRFGGLVPVALVAAAASYQHLSGLLLYYGEGPLISYAGPFGIDGLMLVATGALMARARRASATPVEAPEVPPPAAPAPPVPAPPAPVEVPPPAAPAAPRKAPAKPKGKAGRDTPADRVAAYVARHPDAGPAEIHNATGVSKRTVSRHLGVIRGATQGAPPAAPDDPGEGAPDGAPPERQTTTPDRANGAPVSLKIGVPQ